MISLLTKKQFKPYVEAESDIILLKTNKMAQIVDGQLKGCEIAFDGAIFRVWTAQKQRCRQFAKQYGLRVRLFDKEAELHVTIDLADEILPKFGAKVKRKMSEAQKMSLEKARNASSLGI